MKMSKTITVAHGVPRLSAEQMVNDWSDTQAFERMSGIMPNNRNFGVEILRCAGRLEVTSAAQTARSPVADADLCSVLVDFEAQGPDDRVESWFTAVSAQLADAPAVLRPYDTQARSVQ